ncbi:MAG: VanW family protein [Actinomycetota bacterium]|nr:VanW family protein [Actinomycetota bacterium]
MADIDGDETPSPDRLSDLGGGYRRGMREIVGKAPRPVRYAGVVAAVIVLLLTVALGALQVVERTMDGVLAGVTVFGQDVAGLDRPELRRKVQELAEDHASQPVVVTARGGEVSTTRRKVGSRVDVEDTVDAAWERGRRGWWRGLLDHLAARRQERHEVATIDTEDDVLSAWAADAAGELATSPRPPRLGFVVQDPPHEVDVEVTEAREGRVVDEDALVQRLSAELADPGPVEIEAPVETVSPEIDERDVEGVLGRARTAVSAPVVLSNPTRGDDLELSAEDLASVLEVRPDRSAPSGERLDLHLDSDDLAEHLGEDQIAAMEVSATNASFAIVDEEVRVQGGRAGFQVSLEEAAQRVLELASQGRPRRGELPGERSEPNFSREDAEDLQIKEKVSSFTTEFSCCRPRVDNIHLIADMVDGALIRPGERFELNEHVGPRTRAKGFVAAPAIVGGEFVDVVGGGVSQFATTFFNAAFFSGIELDEFQPHSYYFERYPMGHEATISWRSIDLAVVNDSPYGILVRTSHTNTSVTVEFWSTQWADVRVERIGPTNVREGERRNGFDVTVRRVIEYRDGGSEVEEYFHRYQPQE